MMLRVSLHRSRHEASIGQGPPETDVETIRRNRGVPNAAPGVVIAARGGVSLVVPSTRRPTARSYLQGKDSLSSLKLFPSRYRRRHSDLQKALGGVGRPPSGEASQGDPQIHRLFARGPACLARRSIHYDHGTRDCPRRRARLTPMSTRRVPARPLFHLVSRRRIAAFLNVWMPRRLPGARR